MDTGAAPLEPRPCILAEHDESLSWNCWGLGNLRTVNALAKVVNKEEPIIVFLMETNLKKDWIELIKEKYKMKNCFVVPSIGNSGGLILLWKEELRVDI